MPHPPTPLCPPSKKVAATDLDTGEAAPPPPAALWDRVAGCMAPAPRQAAAYCAVAAWRRETAALLRRERAALAAAVDAADAAGAAGTGGASGSGGAGACASGSGGAGVAVRLAAREALLKLTAARAVSEIAVVAVCSLAVLAPRQLAEALVASWPRLPMPTGICDALRRRQEQQQRQQQTQRQTQRPGTRQPGPQQHLAAAAVGGAVRAAP